MKERKNIKIGNKRKKEQKSNKRKKERKKILCKDAIIFAIAFLVLLTGL
jgi:hypothetical protein